MVYFYVLTDYGNNVIWELIVSIETVWEICKLGTDICWQELCIVNKWGNASQRIEKNIHNLIFSQKYDWQYAYRS